VILSGSAIQNTSACLKALKISRKLVRSTIKSTQGKKIFVIGSSWKDDEDVLLPAVDKILKYEPSLLTVLVPHEPKLTKIQAIEKTFEQKYKNIRSIRFSAIGNYNGENLIIVDSIGLLAALYKSAYISYVGGGFRTGNAQYT
jgi:3-deoxy-D-manno-octulosonic-acid transferase